MRCAKLPAIVCLVIVCMFERAAAQMPESDHSISTHALSQLLTSPRSILLLDIRERSEFAVSRIPQALHVLPSVDVSALIRRLSTRVAGRTVVLYCTIGRRSADLAMFAEDELVRLGARVVLVLEGGIVAWHNERRALVNGGGRTELVHPFSADALRLIKRRDLAPLPN